MGILQLCIRTVDVRVSTHSHRDNNANLERYSTMDNLDGKQARRTGQSSGLGELFEYVSHPETVNAKLLTPN